MNGSGPHCDGQQANVKDQERQGEDMTTPNDGAEPSLASAGSQPEAWAVLRIDGSIYDVYANEEEAKAIDEAVTGNHGVVPLYRSPTLTDEEREALRKVLRRVREDYFAGRFADSVEVAAVIDGLLERTH
jgi:hypothetical protein